MISLVRGAIRLNIRKYAKKFLVEHKLVFNARCMRYNISAHFRFEDIDALSAHPMSQCAISTLFPELLYGDMVE